MEYQCGWRQLTGGQELFVHRWTPTQVTQRLLIIHGLGEHGARYHPLANALADYGIESFAFDQQGHGQHRGRRGCVRNYRSLLDDIATVHSWIESESASQLNLFGHSMGGNLVLNYAMRGYRQTRSIVASSPMIRAIRQPTGIMEWFARILSKVVPNYCLKSDLRPERLMDDPKEQQELKCDKLFHNYLSLRLGAGLVDSGRWLLANSGYLNTQTLLCHGLQDDLTCPEASQEFAQNIPEICQLKLLPKQRHDPFRSLEKENVIESYAQFVLAGKIAEDNLIVR
ncbi:MAG: lysophospholipase [Planctomycetales bacterium]|nr:lysophospholipase [Planctomycetales bacterium]